jgi:hypothetical protein
MQRVIPDSRISLLRRIAALGLVAGLAACGGGSGGTSSGDAPPTAQGRWTSGANATDFTALVVPDTSLAAGYQAWVVANDGTQLARLSIDSANAVSGTRFTLGRAISTTPVTGTASVTGSADTPSLSLPGLAVSNLNLTRTSALTGTTTTPPFGGAWEATVARGAEVKWTVDAATGAVTGTSTNGCTYTGSLTPRSDSPVANANFTESCDAGGPAEVITSFNGIARLNEAQSQLTVVAVSTGGDLPWLVLLVRPTNPG